MRRQTSLVLTALLAMVALAGCGGSQPSATSNSPSPSATTATSEPASPLHGSWRLELTEEQIGKALDAAGYGELTEKFLRAEEIEGSTTQVLTIEEGRFATAYQSGSQPWAVGWKGPATIIGDTVTFLDELSPTRDTLRWTVDGDQLTLELVESNGVELKGLPAEVFDVGYLMAAPFQRVDCVPTEDSCED